MITNSPPPKKFTVEKINPIQNRWKIYLTNPIQNGWILLD